MIKKHKFKKWEVSIIRFRDQTGEKYKVTRRIPELSVAETRFFRDRRKALRLFNKWLK